MTEDDKLIVGRVLGGAAYSGDCLKLAQIAHSLIEEVSRLKDRDVVRCTAINMLNEEITRLNRLLKSQEPK
jgi:hypothetical protein